MTPSERAAQLTAEIRKAGINAEMERAGQRVIDKPRQETAERVLARLATRVAEPIAKLSPASREAFLGASKQEQEG